MLEKAYLINLKVILAHPDNSNQFLSALSAKGLPFALVDESGLFTREQLSEKLYNYGIRGIYPELFYTCNMAAVDYVLQKDQNHLKAGYLGSSALKNALLKGGFQLCQDHADWLFLGLDRSDGYPDFCSALQMVEQGAVMIATNDEPVYSRRDTKMIGAGAQTAMLEYASGRKAFHIGMPQPILAQCAMKYLGTSADNTILIGDCISKDILCGNRAGMETVLISSDMSESADLLREVHPTYLVEDLSGLLR